MAEERKSPESLLKTIKDNKVEMVDLRFTDIPGLWQHFSVPPRALDHDAIADGVGFDGSSIRGFQEIQESDMLVVPDPSAAFLDPFSEVPTLVVICTIRDPVTGESYSRDSRHIAQKAEAYLKGTGANCTPTAASAVQRGMLAAVAGGWKLVAGWRTSVLHSLEDPPLL